MTDKEAAAKVLENTDRDLTIAEVRQTAAAFFRVDPDHDQAKITAWVIRKWLQKKGY
jgi:hypothetical protein